MSVSLTKLLRQVRLRLLVSRPVHWLSQHLPPRVLAAEPGRTRGVVFVTPAAQTPGWILEAVCREVAARMPGQDISICNLGTPLPRARHYFFSHYMFYLNSLSLQAPLHQGRVCIFATHLEPAKHGLRDALLAQLLNRADCIVCMNTALSEELARLGVERHRLCVVVGAASAVDYQPHVRRPGGKVGFCSAFYERKAPDLILEIVRRLPRRRFILLGRGWRQYRRFEELIASPNFEYVEPAYAEYPAYYAQMTVFVSASQLEGGPIPLIEAMMSNVVPVASRTGFAPDVIEHGRNGFLFDVAAPAEHICALVEQALQLEGDVRSTVRHCDWDEFSARIMQHMGLRS